MSMYVDVVMNYGQMMYRNSDGNATSALHSRDKYKMCSLVGETFFLCKEFDGSSQKFRDIFVFCSKNTRAGYYKFLSARNRLV